MDKLITTIDKPAGMDLKMAQIITLTEKNHSRLANLDYESSGHTGFASQKDLEEVMSVASGKSRSFTVQSVQDLGTLFGMEITSSKEEYIVTKSQIVYNGENVNLQNGYVFYIVDDGPDYWFSKDNMKLYATEGLGGVETLVGTDESPIDATRVEAGKYYYIQGRLGSKASIVRSFYFTYPVLVLVYKSGSNNMFILFGVELKLGSGSNEGTVTYGNDISIGTAHGYGGGFGTVNSLKNVNRFNGSNTAENISFYAPTTSGSAGQIQQSNGSGKEPTWVDPSELGLATLVDIENAIGNVSDLLGDTEDLEV